MKPSEIKDLYARLEVNNNACLSEIKKSYRKIVLKWHPDKNDKEEVSKQFIAVSEAYEVLSNPVKRARYDADNQILSFFNKIGDLKRAEEYYTNAIKLGISELSWFYQKMEKSDREQTHPDLNTQTLIDNLEEKVRDSNINY